MLFRINTSPAPFFVAEGREMSGGHFHVVGRSSLWSGYIEDRPVSKLLEKRSGYRLHAAAAESCRGMWLLSVLANIVTWCLSIR